MKTLEIVGFKRQDTGKKYSKALRLDSQVPCVLYGEKEPVHFSVPMILFRDLVYTPNVYQVELNIEGTKFKAILQDIQFHPVSEVILHADFLALQDDKAVKMDIPLKFVGTAKGLAAGGALGVKLRKLSIKALPKDLPDFIEVDITNLELGKSIKVSALPAANYQVMNNPMVSMAVIKIPRALRSAQSAAEEEGEEAEAEAEA
jgi:large subunit ribosomal protein L25